ncbi:uncharacterized protein LOC131242928 isoform X2 [Magnolia sinica]|uniref:uncharacterized protein LOC131242928 isoform X2 n=1 Tax=Magnolia sinica TaxID=86752 RepID=UPI0026587EC5|nr:uncharacterized protein LOC131242928 isoform X2 [Magnolia sinica]
MLPRAFSAACADVTNNYKVYLIFSYYRLGKNAVETDADEIIDMASKASVSDQQKQVQENIHSQIKTFCKSMDDILLPNLKNSHDPLVSSQESQDTPRRSGLGLAVGRTGPHTNRPVVQETQPLTRMELSHSLKDRIGYTLDVKPSQIPHKDAGQGLFIDGAAQVGAVIAFYPGVIYSPAYYRNIPGYPRVDANNPYLITRYDGNVINAQPWGAGSETREVWDGAALPEFQSSPSEGVDRSSDRLWRLLSKPLESARRESSGEVLERRNPLALAHFANHPAKGTEPNVMVCPYDFPLAEADMRTYVPNILFGSEEKVGMKRIGSFWFKSGASGDSGEDVPIMKTLVLVATRALCDEEVFLNYRLSNSKRRPAWYTPVNEEEDQRRWS